jgi:SAM-dependent methyltransferase
MDEYKKLARIYDFLSPKSEIFKQETFFKRLIKTYSVESCLDCTCGTGWHLLLLAKLGLRCFGSDLSPQMLALARKNLKGKKILLKRQDVRELSKSWEQKFDMIISMTTSFPHLETEKDARRALNSIYASLNDGGILVIDSGFPDARLNARPKLLPGRVLKERAFYFFLEYPTPKRFIVNILYVKKTRNSFVHEFNAVHYSAMRESAFRKCFAATKFKRVRYFGSHRFNRFSAKTSRRLIIIAEK